MNKMPEDLRWLAENVSEWANPWPSYIPSQRLPLFAFVPNGEAIYCQAGSTAYRSNKVFSEHDWQAARQQLEDERMDTIARNGNDGLHYDVVMTPEEEADHGFPPHPSQVEPIWNCRCEVLEIPEPRSKYHVEIRPGAWVDVYDVLHAFGVTNPGDQHAIKKMLMPGKRGVKSANQDRREAIASLERAVELEGE